MRRFLALTACLMWLAGCGDRPVAPAATSTSYLDYTGRTDLLGGGVRMIPIETPRGEFRVWTKRVGNSPSMKVLLLHGGPAATHEYFEASRPPALSTTITTNSARPTAIVTG